MNRLAERATKENAKKALWPIFKGYLYWFLAFWFGWEVGMFYTRDFLGLADQIPQIAIHDVLIELYQAHADRAYTLIVFVVTLGIPLFEWLRKRK